METLSARMGTRSPGMFQLRVISFLWEKQELLPHKAMQFKEAIDQFSGWRRFKVKGQTVKGYDQTLRQFCLFLRNPEIEDISINHVMEYLNGMKDMGWDQNSFVGKCMALRKFFEFYRLQGYAVINEELIPIMQAEHKLPRVATEDQYKKFMAVIPVKTNDARYIRNRALVSMLWDTGARNGELLSLNIKDLDMERRRALIRTEKARSRRPFREIFWTADTHGNLVQWLKKRDELKKKMQFKDADAIFLSVTNSQSGQRFTIRGVGEMLRKYSLKAKIPILNAHSFRHRVGHHIIKSGGSSADVMNILGHSSVQSTAIYTMMSDVELEKRYRYFMEEPAQEKSRVARELPPVGKSA